MNFKKLSKIFSEEWIESNPTHPLAIELSSSNPFFLDSLLNLEKNLRVLEKCQKIGRIIRRLKNRQEYFGALFEVEVASELMRRGFEIELQPKLASGKRGDIYIKNKNLFVEVKILGQSNVERRLFEIMHHIANMKFKNLKIRIEFSPKLTKLLELINLFHLPAQETFLETIKKAFIKNLRERIRSNLCLAKTGLDRLAKISIKDSKGSFLGMEVHEMPERGFSRLAVWCIKKAASQLPKDAGGIVVVKTYYKVRKRLVEKLQNVLSKYKHIAGVILLQSYFLNGFSSKKYVIRNPCSNFPIYP